MNGIWALTPYGVLKVQTGTCVMEPAGPRAVSGAGEVASQRMARGRNITARMKLSNTSIHHNHYFKS